jgi:hypothetical protein
MTNLTKNMTLAIAALAMAAGTVSAQSMKAEIPFAFRIGKKVMQPGEYRVSRHSGSSQAPMFTLSSLDSHQAAIAVASYRGVPSKEWADAGQAKLSFLCGDGPCTLTKVWAGEGDAFTFHSAPPKDGDARVAEITLRPDRAN